MRLLKNCCSISSRPHNQSFLIIKRATLTLGVISLEVLFTTMIDIPTLFSFETMADEVLQCILNQALLGAFSRKFLDQVVAHNRQVQV